MWQRRFWGKRRDWTTKPRRSRRVEYNEEKKIFEPVELEEHVVKKVHDLLWYSGIPIFRERERIPKCTRCGAFVCAPSASGHPDLHGWIPAAKVSGSKYAIPFYFEAKRPGGGIQSEEQKQFIALARRDGVVAGFVDSYEKVRGLLAPLGIKLPEG